MVTNFDSIQQGTHQCVQRTICRCEIKNRTQIARSTFKKMGDVLTSRKLHLELGKRLVKSGMRN